MPVISRDDFRQIWHKSRQDLVFTQATALAYTTLLSMVPIFAAGFFALQVFGGIESLHSKIYRLIEENLAPAFSAQIFQYLDGFIGNFHSGTVGLAGLVVFTLTAVSTMNTIERSFNMIWGAARHRTVGRRLITYFSLFVAAAIFFGLSLALSSRVLGWLRADNRPLYHLLVGGFEILPYIASGFFFTGLYVFMPNVTVAKRDAFRAGFITGLIFEIAKLLYALYVAHSFIQNKIYGSLVIIPVFLIWLYVAWLVVLFGAELCCYLQYKRLNVPYKFNVEDRLNPFVVIDIIEVLGRHRRHSQSGLPVAGVIEAIRVPMRELMRHMDFLQGEGWVLLSRGYFMAGDKYLLSVPEENVDFQKIFSQLESRRYVPHSEKGLEVYERFRKLWTEGS